MKIGKLQLKNPIILASGTFDRSIAKKIDVSKLGAIITKTVTPNPRAGNPLPHIYKTKYGFLNSVGWKNLGLKKYIAEELPFWQKLNAFVIPSVGGMSENDFYVISKALSDVLSITAVEVDLSCPTIHKEIPFGSNPKIIKKITQKIKRIFSKTIIIKLTPNVTDISEIAKAAMDGGADAVTCANTYLALEFINQKPIFARKFCGYSGPAIKPLTLAKVAQIHQKIKCPIIASGGIETYEDILDYKKAGAIAFQIGSANFSDPTTSIKILNRFR